MWMRMSRPLMFAVDSRPLCAIMPLPWLDRMHKQVAILAAVWPSHAVVGTSTCFCLMRNHSSTSGCGR